jgi:hypothetical protein
MYIIIKHIKNTNGVEIPVVLIDSHEEVWFFETLEEAEKFRALFEKNSDSGHRYEVKKTPSK